jgi:hypothetical protein
MSPSHKLQLFIAEQEASPELRGTPRESVESALKRLESVAYTKGVAAALSRVETLACMVPGRISAHEVIRLIGVERDAIVAEWQKTVRPC